ncbi:Flp pilus assembly protein CpaB [Spiribacter insolitus]|uniref:Flp pilus assembly protein CpaB n=1 Tax=Spiribacter insolitus TaxID=3122417 RepID=A0ABV3T637_9GAMM
MSPLKRGALLTLGALAAGAAGVWFGDRHLAQRAMALEASYREAHETRQVIVAARDLAEGRLLAEDDVALREVPATYLHDDAVSAAGWGGLADARLRTAIAAGKPILPSHIRNTVQTRLAERISPGDRAITIPVSGGGEIAGLLTPGDRLDLMLTHRNAAERQTVPLLDDVPILATGAQFNPDPESDPRMGYDDLTLAVSPVEAARITHALAIGDIRVVLRADSDDGSVRDYRIDAQALTGGERTEDEVDSHPPVELIIGGRQ